MLAVHRILHGIPSKSRVVGFEFPPFDKDAELTVLPPELAVLLVGVAARQAASPTAAGWAAFDRAPVADDPLAPLDGAFNGPVAAALMEWKNE